MLAFIDQAVIPFLSTLYGAVGYLGVMVAMAIESAMIPLPSELILPYAGFLVSDPSHLEPLTRGPWSFWVVVVVRTFISFPAGVTRMPLRMFVLYSTAGALPWSILLAFAGLQLGTHWVNIRHALAPFDTAIAVAVVAAVVLFVWWRLGTPGRPRRTTP